MGKRDKQALKGQQKGAQQHAEGTQHGEKTHEAINEGFAIVPKPFDLPRLSKALRELWSEPSKRNESDCVSVGI